MSQLPEVQLKELQVQLRRGQRQAAPFSRDEPKSDPKPPGRHPGQGKFTHREQPLEEEIQRTIAVPLPPCPDCGGPVERRASHEQFQVDLPQIQPQITRFRTESGYCPHCRKRVRSRHPEQISTANGAAGVSIGPRAKALAADLKHRMGMPYRKISELLALGLGLPVSAGGVMPSRCAASPTSPTDLPRI
ncbi:MAG TPA: hypothetical protein ENI60_09315, partial [Candidatus Fraserbacteria bacterium]|nr:hypothetical protein [Candidatus Fraserbacteria bacterium]